MREKTKTIIMWGFVHFLALITGIPIALWMHVNFIRFAIDGCFQ